MKNDTGNSAKGFFAFWVFFVPFFFISHWIAIILGPFFEGIVLDFLLFWRWMAFLPREFTGNDPSTAERYLNGGPSILIAIIFWVIVAGAFSRLTRQ